VVHKAVSDVFFQEQSFDFVQDTKLDSNREAIAELGLSQSQFINQSVEVPEFSDITRAIPS